MFQLKSMSVWVMGLIMILASNAAAVTLKIATLSPEGSVWMQKMREGGEEVAQKTEGRVTIKYYPGGVMGDDRAVMQKIRIGQLHGGAVVGGSMVEVFKDSQILGLPFKFRSLDEVDYIRERMDQKIMEGFENNGFVTFGLAEGGFAYMMSDEPVQSAGDFQRKKVWIPDNDSMLLEAIKSFNIKPIPLSIADVRSGLQTRLIDSVGTSPIAAVALQWHTQVKYLIDLPILYLYGVLTVDQKAFSGISPEDQQIVRDVLGKAFKALDQINRQDNTKAMDALKKQGIQIIHPSPEALKEWYGIAATVPDKMVQAGKLSREMVETLENLLKEYRDRNPDASKP
jgi:TRAP-type C4-dicarboxylate transport system substrate-binding protein